MVKNEEAYLYLMQKLLTLLFLSTFFMSCQEDKKTSLKAFELLSELVANEAKPLGLSAPMTTSEIDKYWNEFDRIAKEFNVKIYREIDFPVTSLFPASVTTGKEVVIVYKEPRLIQYQQLKDDLSSLEPAQAARRFGRLLGYSSDGINELLMKNTDSKTLKSFGVKEQITHLYYQDVEAASKFYNEVLGLRQLAPNRFKVSETAILQLNAFDESHPSGQQKSTAIAFLTDQLPQWYQHIQEQAIPIKYTYKPREGGPHDGFVAIDPGGYLLEFEEFKQHPENELFMAYLDKSPRVVTRIDSLNFYGSITWTYHNDLLKMQKFYEEVLGFQQVADQGWTKIYQSSSTGYIGLVDERRGMMDYADDKAVEIEWALEDDEFKQYYSNSEYWSREKGVLIGPEKYRYRLNKKAPK